MVQNHNFVTMLGLMIAHAGEAVSPLQNHMISGESGFGGNIDVSVAESAFPTHENLISGKVGADGNIEMSDAEPARLVRKQMSAAGNIEISNGEAQSLVRKQRMSGKIGANGNIEMSEAEQARFVRKQMSGADDVSNDEAVSPVRKESVKANSGGNFEIAGNTRYETTKMQDAADGNIQALISDVDSSLVRKQPTDAPTPQPTSGTPRTWSPTDAPTPQPTPPTPAPTPQCVDCSALSRASVEPDGGSFCFKLNHLLEGVSIGSEWKVCGDYWSRARNSDEGYPCFYADAATIKIGAPRCKPDDRPLKQCCAGTMN